MKCYICAVKIMGWPFVVATKEQADEWVEKDPDNNYYNETRYEPASGGGKPE